MNMKTNKEIIKKKYHEIRNAYMPDYYKNKQILFQIYAIEEMLNEARADTINKHTGAIWNWWNTKPQKRKNDETIRIITRTDIEELIKMIK